MQWILGELLDYLKRIIKEVKHNKSLCEECEYKVAHAELVSVHSWLVTIFSL